MQRRPLRRRRCTHTGASCTLFYCYTHGPRCKQAQTSGQKRPGVTAGAAKHGMPRTARTPRPSSSGRGQCHRHAAACSSPPRSAASTSSLVSCAWMAVEAVAAHTPATHAPRTHGDLRHALAWAGERTGGRRRGAAHVVQRPGRHAVRGQGELAHRGLQARLDVPARRRRRHEETTAHGAGASQRICVFNRAISCIPWERGRVSGRRAEAGAAGVRAARAHRNAPMFLGSSWHHTSSARAYCDTTCARARAGCTMRPRCRRRPPRRRARPHLHDQVVREGRELLQAHEDRVADAPGASRVAARARPSARVRAPGPARLVWTGSRRRARALAPPNRRAQSAPVRGSCPSMRRHSRQERPGGPAHACGRPT